MFRIYCQFKPNIKRAAGGDGMGPRQGRGAWVVIAVGQERTETAPLIRLSGTSGWRALGVACPTKRHPGTRCNPRKLLAEYQAARHA